MDPSASSSGSGSQSHSVEEQLGELRARVRRLEETLFSYGMTPQRASPAPAHPAPAPPPSPPQSPAARPAAFPETFPAPPPVPIPPPIFAAAGASAASGAAPSLEGRIGSQWFNRIGILAVLIGTAWFLKFAIDNHWIGPIGRVIIGLAAGAGLIAWSERFQSRGYRLFAYSLKAVGSGILYLSLWAAFSLFHLIPSGVAFAAMIAVTAFNGFLAWVQDAELLAIYAIVGGLSTPLLLSTGENHEVALFSYLLLLDLAVLVLVALRPWSRLLVLAFAGTIFFYLGWNLAYYAHAEAGITAFFVGAFFLVFALAPRLAQFRAEESQSPSGWSALALVVLPLANAILGFLAFYWIIDPVSGSWAAPWLCVGFAAFYLLLLRLPAAGRLRPSNTLLSGLHLTAAVVFLTLAIPFKTHGRALTVGWLVEGALLLWIGSRIQIRLLRVLALGSLFLGLVALVAVNPPASTTPIFNQRFATYLVGIAVFAFSARLAHAMGVAQRDVDPEPALDWKGLAGVAVVIVNFLILVAFGWEIHSFWWSRQWQGKLAALPNSYDEYRIYAQFTYSAFFMLFGALLLAVGFARRSAFLRWQALLLVAFTIGKVFLVDMSQLSQAYRILSFLGLGALLLAVSFVYQRDLLKLRAHPDPRAESNAGGQL